MHSQRREHLDCGNHRPISLLSIPRKLMEDVIFNNLAASCMMKGLQERRIT